MRTTLSLRLLLLLATGLSPACGGEQAAIPEAKPAAPVGIEPAPTAVEAPSKPEEPGDPAAARFAKLAKDVEDLGRNKPINRAWLEGELKEIARLDSEHVAARFDLAVLREKDGQVAEARRVYEELTEEDPKFYPAAENLAYHLVAAGKVDEAKEIYSRIIAADPKAPTSRLAMARILQRDGQHPAAIELCRKVLQRKADALEAFRILAQSYIETGDSSMAELIIGRGLKVDPDDPQLHYLAARILLERGKLADGVAKLKHVIRLKPDWLKVRAQLADIALTYSDFGNAAQQLEAIAKVAPNDRATRLGLALSYKGLGRAADAEKILKEMRAQNPKDADVVWNLAMLFQLGDRYDEAMGALKEFQGIAAGGDKDAARVPELVAALDKRKKDTAERQAREARERKRKEAIAAACAAVAKGEKPDADAIGPEGDRIKAAWDLLLVQTVTELQGGAVEQARNSAECALAVAPSTPGAGATACAQLRVNWVQLQDQAGLLGTAESYKAAKRTIEDAVKCDPENPDAQLFLQQLDELIKGAEAAPPPPAEGTPEAGAPDAVP
jgi:tetratricopeptide (TPR) repeat protein